MSGVHHANSDVDKVGSGQPALTSQTSRQNISVR